MTALLQLEDLHVFYGASQALDGVTLQVDEGQAVALMGRNGMGKTTTISAACRMLPLRKGRVIFAGQDISNWPSFRAARLGIGLVPEGRRCFPNLTVRENLIAAARPGRWDMAQVQRLFPRLRERADQYAVSLSGGEQQMLAIGRALMTNPRLLILDEATEGLAPVIRREIWAAITRLRGDGLSILLVDKTLSEILPFADASVILDRGHVIWQGAPDGLTADLQHRYLGV
ncbi:ABC transporter ATP-binding protein [Roseinatronobacter alkalisoli]|uniref:ABC transporter ATP-binding protein n=1 Tax=Roseinatronobacter alkalisoli TaxID=3028235 RepID=A0ABT5T328_9RHOB|nr:ABC transporter ATP-binding protein [Roseinatronobacter sp. HJB301]MDD7969523.1 ABC transporter ATP-binding protein [Roseinatronobacter sp. HJB301]